MAAREPVRRAVAAVAVAAALGTLASPLPAAQPVAGQSVTDATLNVHNGTPWPLIRADVAATLARASVVRLQEAYPRSRAPIRAAVRARAGWRLVFAGAELGIAWDSRTWALVGSPHVRPMPSSGRWARSLQWLTLRHRATGLTVVVGNMHADPGCTVFSRLYLARAEAWALYRLRAHPERPVLLGGDANCHGWGAAIFRRDPRRSIDRLLTSRGAPIRDVARWTRPAYSDHRALFRRLTLYAPRPSA